MKLFAKILLAVSVLPLFCSCDDVNLSGKAGEVLVVIPRTDWDGDLGRAVRDTLGSECSFVLGEPMFNLINVMPSGFGKAFKLHRNVLEFVIGDDSKEEKVLYLKDIWAHPQCVVRIQVKDSDKALALFKEEGGKIVTYIEQAERNRVVSNCKNPKYEDTGISAPVIERFGGSPHFTRGFLVKKKAPDFVWISDEKQYVQQGVFVHSYPALGDALCRDSLLANTSRMLKDNVPGMVDGSYMSVSDYEEVVPTLKRIAYGDRTFTQVRGYWDVKGDYMGGPFVEHAFLNQEGDKVVLLFGYVYSPKYEKRQYLRQVESLLYSFEWKK